MIKEIEIREQTEYRAHFVHRSMTDHDQFMTTLIRSRNEDPPMSRVHLVQGLHTATGKSVRDCAAVVNDYCGRTGVFPLRRGPTVWLPVLPFVLLLGLFALSFLVHMILSSQIAAAPTQAARALLLQERVQRDAVELGLIVVLVPVAIFLANRERRRVRQAAEDARAKFFRQ